VHPLAARRSRASRGAGPIGAPAGDPHPQQRNALLNQRSRNNLFARQLSVIIKYAKSVSLKSTASKMMRHLDGDRWAPAGRGEGFPITGWERGGV